MKIAEGNTPQKISRSNTPTQETINDIFAFLNTHSLTPHIGKEYLFADISKACADMENGKVNGKIVIVVDGQR